MKNISIIPLTFVLSFFFGCTNGQTQNAKTNLAALEFQAKMNALPTAPVVDVRTPEEYAKGHLPNAVNINWNGANFEKEIAALDKTKPVLIYCLSGGRSGAASNKMAAMGFKEIFELTGGIMKWRGANLPETTGNASASKSMTKAQFEELLNNDKLVLIDFYADWCAPCQKMKPYLEEISKDMADKVTVIRINADDNQALCKELKVDALPVLQLYKNKAMAWSFQGFIEKAEVVKEISAR